MNLQVPFAKSTEFNIDLFKSIEHLVSELSLETGKLPTQLIFNGPLGKEVLLYLNELGWVLQGFKLIEGNAGNSIEGGYSEAIDYVETRGAIGDSSLSGKIVNGIPGPETMSKILGAMYSPQFTIEKKIKPNLQIKLVRK
jgi:hypothetical protein